MLSVMRGLRFCHSARFYPAVTECADYAKITSTGNVLCSYVCMYESWNTIKAQAHVQAVSTNVFYTRLIEYEFSSCKIRG